MIKNLKRIEEFEEHKTVRICDLPECQYKRELTELVEDDKSTVNIVAFSGGPYWAAYIGYPAYQALKYQYQSFSYLYLCMNVREFEGVKSNGEKLDEKDARILFPEIAKDFLYRR